MAQLFTPIDDENVLVTGKKPYAVFPTFLAYHGENLKPGDIGAKPIYKFISIKSLSYLLSSSKLFIDRVDSWPDVYENTFLKENVKCDIDGKLIPVNLKSNIDDVFGQCWTTHDETDAMWRIYSYKMDGIRIKTNTQKLLDAVYVDDECMADTWIGNVNYVCERTIHNYIKKAYKTNGYEVFRETYPKTEFMKRKEFAHEYEFRVIKMLDSTQSEALKQYKRLAFNIVVDDFIDEYMLDPRLKDSQFKRKRRQLIKLGANPEKIVKSPLYQFTPANIVMK